MREAIAPAKRFVPLFGSDEDARRLTTVSLLCNGAAYAHLLLAAGGMLPGWTLLLTVPILVPRWMIAVHELFHLRSERELDCVTRLLPFSFTLISVGYRELLVNHRSHHRHMATPLDAEYFQLRGSPLAGLFNAVSAPEQLWFRWIAEHGMDGALLRDTLVRLMLTLALIGAAGTSFLWYWVPARVAFGLSYFIFFYCLHRRGGAFGVYPLVLPGALVRVARLLWGHDVVAATLHHDVHHAQPRIAARRLAEARTTLREVPLETCPVVRSLTPGSPSRSLRFLHKLPAVPGWSGRPKPTDTQSMRKSTRPAWNPHG